MTSQIIAKALDETFPSAQCELEYKHDYELLIAVVLSAQSTDKRVNQVTKQLFSKYDIFSLANASIEDLETIIYPVGTFRRKAKYIKMIAQELVTKHKGKVPNDRDFLENLPGVGHKTANVVLSNIHNIPAIAVDTHISRVSKRLRISNQTDTVTTIEHKLMQFFPKERWTKTHHQLVLFGRYICKSARPLCHECPLNNYCQEPKKTTQ